jgi:hypothetical protein
LPQQVGTPSAITKTFPVPHAAAGPAFRHGSVVGVVCWIAAVASCLTAAPLLWYLHQNQSNHTAFEPWLLSFVFVPTTIVGIVHLSRTRRVTLSGAIAFVIGVLGFTLLIYIDQTNRMLQYERWLSRGMPVHRK